MAEYVEIVETRLYVDHVMPGVGSFRHAFVGAWRKDYRGIAHRLVVFFCAGGRQCMAIERSTSAPSAEFIASIIWVF